MTSRLSPEDSAAAASPPASSAPRLRWPPGACASAGLAAALCLALWLPTLASLPAWHDEIITLRTLELPTLDLAGNRLKNAHSPVYFVLLQWWGYIAGNSLFMLRLPSALGAAFGAACMALFVYRLGGGRAGGWRAALLLAPLFGCFPILLAEAQDARPYGPLYGFLGLFAWSTAYLVDHPRLAQRAWPRAGHRASRSLRLAWYGATIGALGLAWMLPLGVLAMLAGDAAVLWAARERSGRRLLRRWFRLRAVTLIVLAPLLYGVATNMATLAPNYWPPELSRFGLEAMFDVAAGARVYWGDQNRFLGQLGGQVLAWGLPLSMVVGLLFARRRPSRGVAVALAVLPVLLLIAMSLHTSLLVARYFAIATPPLVALSALGLAGFWGRWPLAGIPFAAAILTLLFLQSLDTMERSSKPRFDLAMAKLREAGVERLGISVRDGNLAASMMYTLRGGPEGVRLPSWSVVHAARRGLLVWVASNGPLDPTWAFIAARSNLATCQPAVAGIRILAIAAQPEDLASSCPEPSGAE